MGDKCGAECSTKGALLTRDQTQQSADHQRWDDALKLLHQETLMGNAGRNNEDTKAERRMY